MTREFFAEQIARLRTEWQSAYGKERMEVLYAGFSAVPDEVFRDAVTELLADHKGGAPMRREIERAIEEARTRWKARQWERGYGGETTQTPPDCTVTPERLQRVKNLVRSVVAGAGTPAMNSSYSEREKRRTSQLRLLSPQEKAAGEKESGE